MTTTEIIASPAKSLLYMSDKRTLFIGHFKPILVQSHAASTLVIALDKPLRLLSESGDVVTESLSFLMPAGIELSMDTQGSRVLVCFLDALGVDLAILEARMQGSVPVHGTPCHFGLSDVDHIADKARQWLDDRPPAEVTFSWLDQWIGPAGSELKVPGDVRIARAVALIKRNYSKNDSIDDLAHELCLSVPRLAQLFRQITGIPIRRYRLWHRLYVTLLGVSQGLSLNEAALNAGFSDYSHFSRAFKSIGGINPSDVLSGRNAMDIQVLASDSWQDAKR